MASRVASLHCCIFITALWLVYSSPLSNQTESQAVWIEDEVTTDYFPVNATLATQKPISQLLIVMSGVVRYKTYQIARKINDIGLSVMIPVGIVGNTLSIIVLGHRRNLHVSCSVYMVALACSDNGLLMVAAYVLYNQIVMKSRIDDVACKTSTYLIYVLTTYSTLLIVFVTLDRLIAVRFPLKAKQYCTSMSAFIKSLCLAIVAVVGNVHHIRWSKVHEGLMCAAYSYDHVIAVILSWASIVINSLLPFVIILSCNSVIIWTIRKRTSFLLALPSNKTSLPAAGTNQRQEAPSNQGARSACSSQSSTETQLTIMLLLASFVFLILTLPQYIRLMIYHLFNWYKDSETLANYLLFFHISHKMFFLNSAVNFWLYLMTGSRFRNDVRRMLGCFGAAQPTTVYEPSTVQSGVSVTSAL